jgi:hypothetical protein
VKIDVKLRRKDVVGRHHRDVLAIEPHALLESPTLQG